MNIRTMLEELTRLGVELRAEGDYLCYEGPEEAVTPGLLDRLREHKAELIKVLADEGCCQAHVMRIGPSTRRLIRAGWKPKQRSNKTIWRSPENGFWYAQEIALVHDQGTFSAMDRCS